MSSFGKKCWNSNMRFRRLSETNTWLSSCHCFFSSYIRMAQNLKKFSVSSNISKFIIYNVRPVSFLQIKLKRPHTGLFRTSVLGFVCAMIKRFCDRDVSRLCDRDVSRLCDREVSRLCDRGLKALWQRCLKALWQRSQGSVTEMSQTHRSHHLTDRIGPIILTCHVCMNHIVYKKVE